MSAWLLGDNSEGGPVRQRHQAMCVLGVVGTMVWDTIWRDADAGSPMEEWGGITYALAAADAVVPPDFQVLPIVRLGSDLAERGLQFLSELSVIQNHDVVSIVEDPNERGYDAIRRLFLIEMTEVFADRTDQGQAK